MRYPEGTVFLLRALEVEDTDTSSDSGSGSSSDSGGKNEPTARTRRPTGAVKKAKKQKGSAKKNSYKLAD